MNHGIRADCGPRGCEATIQRWTRQREAERDALARSVQDKINRDRLRRLQIGCTCRVGLVQCQCGAVERDRANRERLERLQSSGCGCSAGQRERDRAKLDELRRGAGLPPLESSDLRADRDFAKLNRLRRGAGLQVVGSSRGVWV